VKRTIRRFHAKKDPEQRYGGRNSLFHQVFAFAYKVISIWAVKVRSITWLFLFIYLFICSTGV
jgi:hypothetical protein